MGFRVEAFAETLGKCFRYLTADGETPFNRGPPFEDPEAMKTKTLKT